MIRVLLVDDHVMVRMGLRTYLETEADMQVIGEASHGQEAVRMAVETSPDVILMDLLMPGMSGIEATNAIREAGLPSQIIILTSSLEDTHMVEALKSGALSYLLKTSSPETVVRAVRSAIQKEPVLDAEVQKRLVGGLRNQGGRKPEDDLTDRERDVLRGIAAGQNNQEIADVLGIGVKTVKTHVSNILLKLGLSDRTQAAIYAIKKNLD